MHLKKVQNCSVEKPVMNHCPIRLLHFANNYMLHVNEVRNHYTLLRKSRLSWEEYDQHI